jgi:hypothetical protein
MLDILPKHPSFSQVRAADAIIRATRSDQYFATWDQLTFRWCEFFGVESPMPRLLGANLGAGNDLLFEQTSSHQVDQVFEAIQEMTDLEQAAHYLQHEPVDLLDAVKNHTALITERGYSLLVENSRAGLSERWLTSWQTAILNQNQGQVDYIKTASMPDQRVGVVSDLDTAFETYLDRFALTDAITVSVIAAFPFSNLSSEEGFLDALLALVDKYARYIRLVEDYPYDETEPLNLPLFAVATSKDINLGEAKNLLEGDSELLSALETTILKHSNDQLEILARANQDQCRHLEASQGEVLNGLLDTVLDMCSRHINR